MSAASLRIAAVEPYAATSHALFLEELARHSRHRVELFTLPARAWKWRMRTASFDLAPRLAAAGPFDLLFVSDYVDLPELRALLPRALAHTPAVAYFHENQLTYPLRGDERRDHHFALSHLYTLHGSEHALFNSRHHLETFLPALEELLGHVPDVDLDPALARVRERTSVLPLGTALAPGAPRPPREEPIIAWNHRWEHDKDPEAFARALLALDLEGDAFRVRLLGQRFRAGGEVRARLARVLGERCEDLGPLPARADYLAALAGCDLVVSTARHEFFGLATLEALRLGLRPVLPDDLAYPELVPAELRSRCLYRRTPNEDGLLPALRSALAEARLGDDQPLRRKLVQATERFSWNVLAPRYDAVFEQYGARRTPPRFS